jgi:predicted ATPase
MTTPRAIRVALTGGPGAGKTTAADLMRREVGDRVVIVPETASMLFAGGFPRRPEPDAKRAAQTAIYYVQRGLEDVFAAAYPTRVLLCDRGTIDGAAYWPNSAGEFFASAGTTLEAELARWDRHRGQPRSRRESRRIRRARRQAARVVVPASAIFPDPT